MDRIILLFEIANSQEDYSYLMQIIHLMECESEDIDIERLKCILPIKYLWDKTSGEYTNSQMVYRVERECFFKKGLFTEYQISNLNDLIKKRKDYDYYYYIRIKKHENHDIKNLQYFLLILQQFPAVCDRICIFFEPFEGYYTAKKNEWAQVSVYYKYSHFLRFILEKYNKVFFSAFFHTKDNEVKIASLSLKKAGVQSTFFPLIEVDSEIHSVFTRYFQINSLGQAILEKNMNRKIYDLNEISKRILEKRMSSKKRIKKEAKSIQDRVYSFLSKEPMTTLEFALISVLLPVDEGIRDDEIEYCRDRVRSICAGIIQLIENIVLHSNNHKGTFTFRIVKNRKQYINDLLLDGSTVFDDPVLEVDVSDSNLCENIIDNFLKKQKIRESYFHTITPSISNFFGGFKDKDEKDAWALFRNENPVKCLGLERLNTELKLRRAIIQVRSDTSYYGKADTLTYEENYYDNVAFQNRTLKGYIPGTQFLIKFPIFQGYEAKQNNANILLEDIGSFIERDETYANYVDFQTEYFDYQKQGGFKGYKVCGDSFADLDRCISEKCNSVQIDNPKDYMVILWRGILELWIRDNTIQKKVVYCFDMNTLKYTESLWGAETFCKAFCSCGFMEKNNNHYIAFINCTYEFIRMFFETVILSGKSMGPGIQIYLHSEGDTQDFVIAGRDKASILHNALQYCYTKGKIPYFLERYKKIEIGSKSDTIELFPFDVVIGKPEDEMTLFEHYLEEVADHELTAIDEAGFLLSDSHMRLGNKVHLDRFYEVSILFRKPRIARKTALLIIRKMKKEGVDICKDTLFYGYASYSRAILTSLVEIIKYYQISSKNKNAYVEFAVYQNDIMIQRTLTHISPKVRMYFSQEMPNNKEIQVIQVVPISTTLTTFKKMWDVFDETYSSKKKYILIKNYTLFWVRDSKSKDAGKASDIENDYWKEIKDNRLIQTEIIQPSPNFFCCKKIGWYHPLNCEQCYPDNALDELALVETDVTSTVPSQQLEVSYHASYNNNDKKNIVNEIRIVNLRDCILYGHVSRGGNHFQYYIDTILYFQKEKKQIADWLKKLSINKIHNQKALNFIVTPQHHTNVEFGHYVNNYYYNGSADIITIDSEKEYRSNIVAKYADVKSAIQMAYDFGAKISFVYVDDTIITGSTFRRVNNLLHSLVPEGYSAPIEFDQIFVLVNRLSSFSKIDYVDESKNNFHAFVDINISSVRNFGDSCTMCTMQKNSKLFFKRSATKMISQHWDFKQYDYKEIQFDKYDSMPNADIMKKRGYYRVLCSHYAKTNIKMSKDYTESIKSIVEIILNLERLDNTKPSGEKNYEIEETEEMVKNCQNVSISPIYYYGFSQDIEMALGTFFKVLCRPFFSFGKIYRQAILDLLLILTEMFLNTEFVKKVKDEKMDISRKKTYLNDMGLRDKIVKLYNLIIRVIPETDYMKFIENYLLEGLTDLKSNYLLRLHSIRNYRSLIQQTNDEYHYNKYERMVYRIINNSSDETKTLWMEYLLITGEENAGYMNGISNVPILDYNKMDEHFGSFWDALQIENTRLYYDSMLNFVKKVRNLNAQSDDENSNNEIERAVELLWGDYYIKNLRRFVRLEVLAETKDLQLIEDDINKRIKDRIVKTARLLYLLKTVKTFQMDRYERLKSCIVDLLYQHDELLILTSAKTGEVLEEELYAITGYQKENAISAKIKKDIENAQNDTVFKNKNFYIGENYIVILVNNNIDFLTEKKIHNNDLVKIKPIYFYIQCDTSVHVRNILRIRRILMYRHQLLHWFEDDFNNNLMTVLASQMEVKRQLIRDRAGDHASRMDITLFERVLQEGEIKDIQSHRWLLLKAYVNMRIARLFRCEWSEHNWETWNKVYTMKRNEDKLNKAFVNMKDAFFGETYHNLKAKNYLEIVKDLFVFDLNIYGEIKENVKLDEMENLFDRLKGRCIKNYYYKQEYIIAIVLDVLFNAIKSCCCWEIELHKYYSEHMQDKDYTSNALDYYYVLKNGTIKCKIEIRAESGKERGVDYLVLKNKVYGLKKEEINQKNEELQEKITTKQTKGLSLQAMKWYTEFLNQERRVKAEFEYKWDENNKHAVFVTKLPILEGNRKE